MGQGRITIWVYKLNTRAREFYRREGRVELDREQDQQSHLMYVYS